MKHSMLWLALLAFTIGCSKTASEIDGDVTNRNLVEDSENSEMAHPELDFFNSLAAQLEIELTAPPERIGNLENVRATPEAKIKSIELVPEVFNQDTETFRELAKEELQSIAFRGGQITLRGEGGGTATHDAPNGEYFTVKELLDAVTETEKQSRANSEWFEGIDVHHVFFEGIHRAEDGVWDIYWGS